MKKQTSTKRALITSALSVLMCGSMLVGTTFAWFTDTVTSGKNKIVAGNLDVELYTRGDDGNYTTKVTKDTNLFKEGTLWEPGHVEVAYLKVANEGTLALTYKFAIDSSNEKGGISVKDDSPFKLSDYLKYGVVLDDEPIKFEEGTESAQRAAAIKAVDSDAKLLSVAKLNPTADKDGTLYPKDTKDKISEQYVALVVYMPTDVENDANYKKGTEAPTIDLAVNLIATQVPYESDSFNENYDEKAKEDMPDVVVGTSNGLADAINGKGEDETNINIELGSDVDVTTGNSESYPASGIIVDNGKDVNLDGNGKTVTLGHTAFNNYETSGGLEGITSGTLNFKNVNFKNEEEGQNGYVTTLGFDSEANVVFENCTFDGMFSAVYINNNDTGNVTVTFKNCTFKNTKYVCGMGDKELEELKKEGGRVKVVFEGTVTFDDETVEDPQEVCGWEF